TAGSVPAPSHIGGLEKDRPERHSRSCASSGQPVGENGILASERVGLAIVEREHRGRGERAAADFQPGATQADRRGLFEREAQRGSDAAKDSRSLSIGGLSIAAEIELGGTEVILIGHVSLMCLDRADRQPDTKGQDASAPSGTLAEASEELKVRRGDLAVAAGLEVVGDLLALAETGKARALYGGDVDEGILGAIIRLDEAKAFGGVEEFYGAIGHVRSFVGDDC